MKYSLPFHGETVADAQDIQGIPRYADAEEAAEAAAEYFHSHRDGWDCAWPVVFEIWSDEEVLLGLFSVERESVPQFTAYKTEGPV